MDYPKGLSFGSETRVVLIGTSECPKDNKSLPPIPHVKRNIEKLVTLFKDPDIVGLPQECIIPFLDVGEYSEILRNLKDEADKATDTFIVYYAGHGLWSTDDVTPLYLAVKNTVSLKKKYSAIPFNFIREIILGCQAKKRILILDCCYSGRVLNTMDDDDLTPVVGIEGAYWIAATASTQPAKFDEKDTNSLTKFTEALVKVLSVGIPSASETLTIGMVFDEIKRHISEKPGDIPMPRSSNLDEGKNFMIAKNRQFAINQRDYKNALKQAVKQLPKWFYPLNEIMRLEASRDEGSIIVITKDASNDTKLQDVYNVVKSNIDKGISYLYITPDNSTYKNDLKSIASEVKDNNESNAKGDIQILVTPFNPFNPLKLKKSIPRGLEWEVIDHIVIFLNCPLKEPRNDIKSKLKEIGSHHFEHCFEQIYRPLSDDVCNSEDETSRYIWIKSSHQRQLAFMHIIRSWSEIGRWILS